MRNTVEDAVRALGGVWPSSEEVNVSLYRLSVGEYIADLSAKSIIRDKLVCTRDEFEECAKRLRNEPRWDDAPAWAVAKAQNSNGVWSWWSNKPESCLAATGNEGVWMHKSPGVSLPAGKGEVIGDWKQTLRLRPEVKKMENKNDWHKRGEYPPVGTECEVMYYGTWEQTKIIGWHDAVIVITTEWDDTHSYDGVSAEPSDFRPLRTERERWMDSAERAMRSMSPELDRLQLEAIYDAGLAKMPEDK